MKILLYDGHFRYGLASTFLQGMARAFEELGHVVTTVSLTDADVESRLNAICSDGVPDLVLSFNAVSPTVDGAHQTYHVPHVFWLLDHPLYNIRRVVSWAERATFLTIDSGHAAFLKAIGVARSHIVQHAGHVSDGLSTQSAEGGNILWDSRNSRPFFPGSVVNPKVLRKQIHQQLFSHADTQLLDLYEYAIACPIMNDSNIANMLHTVLNEQKPTSVRFMQLFLPILNWLRNQRRVDIVQQFDDAGIGLDLCGDGWDDIDHAHHTVLPTRSLTEVYAHFQTRRWVMHVNPFFNDGLHERPINAALAGAGVICDGTPALVDTLQGVVPVAHGTTSHELVAAFQDSAEHDFTPNTTAHQAFVDANSWTARAQQILDIVSVQSPVAKRA